MLTIDQSIEELGYCVVDLTGHDLRISDSNNHCTLFVMCTQGSIDLEMNMERLHLEAGLCLIYTNLQFLNRFNVSPDFHARALLVNDKLALSSTAGIKGEILRHLTGSPVYRIDDAQVWDLLESLLHSAELYATLPSSQHANDVVGSMLRAIVFILGETAQPVDVQSQDISSYGKTNTYFRKFISLVNENVQHEHDVLFYASHLKISPKYLGKICQKKSGRKAKETISLILINQIKHDILESDDSIKGLAYKYGFSDQSSLGKFFRKMTGMSPVKYKQTAR